MLDKITIKGFYVWKLFKFLKLNIYDEWCSSHVYHILACSQLWLHSETLDAPILSPTFLLASLGVSLNTVCAREVNTQCHWQILTCPLSPDTHFPSQKNSFNILPALSQAAPGKSCEVCLALISINVKPARAVDLLGVSEPIVVFEHRQHFGHRCDWLIKGARRINWHNNTSFTGCTCDCSSWLSLVLIYCFYSVFKII